MGDTDGRTAIVTGASRGIGAAVAERLARDGFAVVINYAGDAAPADALVRKIEEARGRALAARADVSDPQAVRRLFDAAEAAFGGVEVLVNNAGIMTLANVCQAITRRPRPPFNPTTAPSWPGRATTQAAPTPRHRPLRRPRIPIARRHQSRLPHPRDFCLGACRTPPAPSTRPHHRAGVRQTCTGADLDAVGRRLVCLATRSGSACCGQSPRRTTRRAASQCTPY